MLYILIIRTYFYSVFYIIHSESKRGDLDLITSRLQRNQPDSCWRMQMLISDENLSLLGHFHELSQLTSAEITLLHVFLGCCALYFLFGLGSFVALGIFRVQSAYGRYSNSSGSTFFDKLENGRFVPARTAWVIQECPSFIIPLTMFVHKHSKTSYREFREGTFMRLESLLLFCFLFHYFHRTFIFPLRIRGG